MAKKHHMTKHQYKAYEKKHRSQKYDDDDGYESKIWGKMRSRHEDKLKNQLRHLHGTAADLLEEDSPEGEEYEEEKAQIAS